MKSHRANRPACLYLRLVASFTAILIGTPAFAAQITGSATDRERLALPPDAVFEARLEDVSKADAPAIVVGSVKLDKPGQPPIRFEIPYDPARIDPSHAYNVRAQILIDGRPRFITDQAYPVLTRGHGGEVQMLLRMAGAAKSAQAGPLQNLPATFAGELPCADCPGIRYHLNLYPDRVFFLRMTYLGKGDGANFDEIGSWVPSSDGTVLVLKGGRGAPEFFALKDRDTLRKLDIEGREITSAFNYDLRRAKSVEPLEPRLTLRGMYRYYADAGLFTECLTRRRWPVAQEKDNAALESNYTKARLTPGEELMVNLEGQVAMRPRVDGRGSQPALVVERFIAIAPGEACGARFSSAPLANTQWQLIRLNDKQVTAPARGREPGLTLDGKTKRVAGFGGCNRLTGSYQQNGRRLSFGKIAMTFMACVDAMESEREFVTALEQVRSWRTLGQHLELFANDGALLARFEARP